MCVCVELCIPGFGDRSGLGAGGRGPKYQLCCIRQHTSAYVSIRIREVHDISSVAYVSMRQHTAAYAYAYAYAISALLVSFHASVSILFYSFHESSLWFRPKQSLVKIGFFFDFFFSHCFQCCPSPGISRVKLLVYKKKKSAYLLVPAKTMMPVRGLKPSISTSS